MDRTLLYTLHLINATLWLAVGILVSALGDGFTGTCIVGGALIAKLVLWMALGSINQVSATALAGKAFHPAD